MKIKSFFSIFFTFLILSCAAEPPTDKSGDTYVTGGVKLINNTDASSDCFIYSFLFGGAKIYLDVRYYELDNGELVDKGFWGPHQEFNSSDGYVDAKLPVDGDFIIQVRAVGECDNCCSAYCGSSLNGQPVFQGESDLIDAVSNDGKTIYIDVEWRRCSECGCSIPF